MNAFSHFSLLIDLDCEQWWPESAAYTAPSTYFPRRSRRLLHESLHYWQQLSQGYLLLLAEEDWLAFQEFANTGKSPPEGPRRQHFRQPEGRHGFSPWSIAESLTQFWEVFLAGPENAPRKDGAGARSHWHSDADFDAAMLASRDYSEPFRLARRLLDPKSSLILFPFLAHFSLKTARPAFFFERFLATVAEPVAAKAAESSVLDPNSGTAPGALYSFVEQSCAEVIRSEGEKQLLHASAIFPQTALNENPAYLWSFVRLERLAARVRAGAALDTAICFPTGSHMTILAEELPPPCLRFADGTALALAHGYLQKKAAAPVEQDEAQRAAEACLGLQARSEELRASARGY